MEINKYCANKLKSLRERKNITQQELAEALHINQQQVARYENNQRQFKQDFLFEIANYFNVSISEFFPPSKYNNHINLDNDFDKIFFTKYNKLSLEQKELLMSIVDNILKESR